jgi:hypothetical protein
MCQQLLGLGPFLSGSAAMLAVVVGVFTLGLGLRNWHTTLDEYRKANVLKRFQSYVDMRKTFDGDPIKSVRNAVLTQNGKAILVEDKEAFLAFYEELEIMTKSGLINDNIVYYLFGWFLLKARDDARFSEIAFESQAWVLLASMVDRMRAKDREFGNPGTRKKILEGIIF